MHYVQSTFRTLDTLPHADDVLLLAPSVSSLQIILAVYEKALHRLDMMINVKKSLSAHRALPQGPMQ